MVVPTMRAFLITSIMILVFLVFYVEARALRPSRKNPFGIRQPSRRPSLLSRPTPGRGSRRINPLDDIEEWSRYGGMLKAQWERSIQKLEEMENLEALLERSTSVPTSKTLRRMQQAHASDFWSENATFPCMMYTEEQLDSVLEELNNRASEQAMENTQEGSASRGKRAIKDFSSSSFLQWDSFPINYGFDERHSAEQQEQIRSAFHTWEDNTCISFNELTRDELEGFEDNHILVTNQRTGCHSYIGKVHLIPQQLNLQYNCLWQSGIPLHEIGHSLGLVHTQQRHDRDEHIIVHHDQIRDYRYNGQYIKDPNTHAYDVPYDMTSVMHYSAFSAAVGNSPVLEAIDPRYQNAMGQRNSLSFYDIKVVNRAYCSDVCTEPLEEPCQNEGYQDPTDCSRCRCPDGLSGRFCTEVAKSGDNSPVECSEELTATPDMRVVESPGYATNTGAYQKHTECNWLINAPPQHRVVMWFGPDFGLYKTTKDECRHWVEVKSSLNLGLNGQRYCGYEAPENMIRSEGSSMLITLRAPEYASTHSMRGVRIHYTAEFDPSMPLEEITTTAPVPNDFHWECSFESADGTPSLCGMTQSSADDFDWTLQEGPTRSRNTGPLQAASEPYYAFIETSRPRNRDDIAKLETPTITTEGPHCLRFLYHMYGDNINTLEVKVVEQNSRFHNGVSLDALRPSANTEYSIFMKTSEVDRSWHEEELEVDLAPNSKFSFSGIRGSGYKGDIALDNIEVHSGRC